MLSLYMKFLALLRTRFWRKAKTKVASNKDGLLGGLDTLRQVYLLFEDINVNHEL